MNDAGPPHPGKGLIQRIRDRLNEDGLAGVHFAANVLVASAITWWSLTTFTHANPVWATASMVASSEPVHAKGRANFRARLINTLVGCAIGLAVLALGGDHAWKLPFALALAVLISAYLVRIQVMWRQAPITAAIVVAGSLTQHSKLSGMELGLRRVAEVLFGCLVALAVSWVMERVWPLARRSDES
ncbi:MAG: FUSC family protein [Exiguobacterium profundum]|nr:MAG: FUSC family protein [Exiguobacterium profundum]